MEEVASNHGLQVSILLFKPKLQIICRASEQVNDQELKKDIIAELQKIECFGLYPCLYFKDTTLAVRVNHPDKPKPKVDEVHPSGFFSK